MTILRGRAALDVVGFPHSHGTAFQTVANQKNSIIMSRAVGSACTGLIEESYASKGFHVKAKSCNWGPMAGFVVEDPNLTKRTPDEFASQAKDLKRAFDHGATSVRLYISQHRKVWLTQNGYMSIVDNSDRNRPIFRAVQRDGSINVRTYQFVLKRRTGANRPRGATTDMWAIYYHDPTQPVHLDENVDDGSARVRAMVDPRGMGRRALGYRAAMTGDYDLFALWTHKSLYRPESVRGKVSDQRMISHKKLERNIRKNRPTGEDEHLGNMTGRLRQVRDALNIQIQRAGYKGGDMVHHSDEAGRPFVNDIDMPAVAFVPKRHRAFAIQDVGDLRMFIKTVVEPGGYAPTFNPGWMKELVPGRMNFGAHELNQMRGQLVHVEG